MVDLDRLAGGGVWKWQRGLKDIKGSSPLEQPSLTGQNRSMSWRSEGKRGDLKPQKGNDQIPKDMQEW